MTQEARLPNECGHVVLTNKAHRRHRRGRDRRNGRGGGRAARRKGKGGSGRVGRSIVAWHAPLRPRSSIASSNRLPSAFAIPRRTLKCALASPIPAPLRPAPSPRPPASYNFSGRFTPSRRRSPTLRAAHARACGPARVIPQWSSYAGEFGARIPPVQVVGRGWLGGG